MYQGRTAPQVHMTWIPSEKLRPIQRSQSHDFVRYTLKTTDIPLDVRYKGLVALLIRGSPWMMKE